MGSGRIQNEDIKSEAELLAAGGTKSQLTNDTKIFVTANGINKRLDEAIADGDIGGGGSGDASELLERLKSEYSDCFLGSNIFKTDLDTKIDVSSTGTLNEADGVYELDASEFVLSENLLDVSYSGIPMLIRLSVFWLLAKIDTAAIYQVSVDGGTTWKTVTMERNGETDEYFGEYEYNETPSSPYDLRLKITSSAAGKAIAGYGVAYGFESSYENADPENKERLDFVGQHLSSLARVDIPLVAAPYTTIVNRALMNDLANDLHVVAPVERFPTQEIFSIKEESGPNGEIVFGSLNDYENRIRFVGNWKSTKDWAITGHGDAIRASEVGCFAEVSFFGTGLNMLTLVTGYSPDWRASVDGGAEGSNLYTPGSSGSGILISRSYSPNTVLPVVSGLSLGFHTVKIRLATAFDCYIYGFEFLNESSSITIRPGSYYAYSNKLFLSTSKTRSLTEGVTGTKGGCKVEYLNPDDTTGYTFNPTDSTAKYLTNTDHSNEEMIRNYHFTEFGCGRSDDFSADLTGSPSDRYFTLEDGMTTLVCKNALKYTSGTATFGLTPQGGGGFFSFLFFGTGLDILIGNNTGQGSTFNVQVDGVLRGTYTSIAGDRMRILKIASGLPMGAHVVVMGGHSLDSLAVHEFRTYATKAISIPSNAKELCKYYVLSNYVARTGTYTELLPQGVIVKSSSREHTYVGSWNSNLINTSVLTGSRTHNGTLNEYMESSFVGTGFGYQNYAESSGSNYEIYINGVLFNASNFPTASVDIQSYSYNSGTGLFTPLGSNVYEGSVVITGLPFGHYRVKRVNKSNTYMYFSAFYVVPLIYTPKENRSYVTQNTLPTGNCSLSDLRQVGAASETPKVRLQAFGKVSNPTTTVGDYIPCPDMSIVLNASKAGMYEVLFSATARNDTSGYQTFFVIFVDGVQRGAQMAVTGESGYYVPVNATLLLFLSKGTHKVDVYWCVSAGSVGWLRQTYRVLTVKEL